MQYQWHNQGFGTFDDFLATFSSKKRNQIRRERRELENQGITIRTLRGDEITAEASTLSTSSRADGGQVSLGKALPQQGEFFVKSASA